MRELPSYSCDFKARFDYCSPFALLGAEWLNTPLANSHVEDGKTVVADYKTKKSYIFAYNFRHRSNRDDSHARKQNKFT